MIDSGGGVSADTAGVGVGVGGGGGDVAGVVAVGDSGGGVSADTAQGGVQSVGKGEVTDDGSGPAVQLG